MTSLFSSSTDYQPPVAGQSDFYSHFQIRPAQSEDLSELAELLADSFHSHQGIFSWAYPLLRLGIYEDLRNRLRSASPHHICLVGVERNLSTTTESSPSTAGNKLTGTLEMAMRSGVPWASQSSRYLYLSNLAVRPTYRRRGVARQLLLTSERVALSWGFQDIYLHVLENNHPARQLYFQLGYRLHRVDSNWNAWLLRRPRQLFLHKHLSANSTS